jgi:hypothetical protein
MRTIDMSDQSEAQRLVSLQQRLESLAISLRNANAPAAPAEPPNRAPKPIALTLRVDPERYTRLCTHATRFTPRKSFQSIITEAIDQYLGE